MVEVAGTVAGVIAVVGAMSDLHLYTRKTGVARQLRMEAPPMPEKDDITTLLLQFQDMTGHLKARLLYLKTGKDNIANWYCCKCPLQEKRSGVRPWDSRSEDRVEHMDAESMLDTHSDESHSMMA